MANRNDYKIIAKKSSKYFEYMKKELNLDLNNVKEKDAERLGFYIFILEHLTNEKDIIKLTDMITDTEFNKIVFSKHADDYGVDAVHINEDENEIQLYNFKYRDDFKSRKQSINDVITSSRLLNVISNEDLTGLTGKTKEKAEEVLEKLLSKDSWKFTLYVVSNQDLEPITKDDNLRQFEIQFGLEVILLGLEGIGEYISLRPKDVDAELILNLEAIMSYSENNIASSISYVLRLPLNELVRITCNDKDLRNEYSIEDYSKLSSVSIEYSVLFDNVRGLVLKSKYNENISSTLRSDASKFFMYNNGLTLVAKDIIVEETSAKKRIRVTLKSFQVLNGGQTLRTIHAFNEENDQHLEKYLASAQVLVRVFKTSSKQELNSKIAEYTNSQNAISVIDLKSLRTEQLQLEQYLDEHGIIYSRKSGDTGLDDGKKYVHKISMERFGQILFSLKGYPEKASNQKKNIFDKYYHEVFGADNLRIEDSPQIIEKYFEIRDVYGKLKEKYGMTDQKVFFILYLNKRLDQEIDEIIRRFEELIVQYEPDNEKTIALSRKLIQSKFKIFVDKKLLEV